MKTYGGGQCRIKDLAMARLAIGYIAAEKDIADAINDTGQQPPLHLQ